METDKNPPHRPLKFSVPTVQFNVRIPKMFKREIRQRIYKMLEEYIMPKKDNP